MNLLRASANRLSACGRALRPWLWRTLLPAAVLDPSGQASPAERQPCRTAGARFMAARVLGRGRLPILEHASPLTLEPRIVGSACRRAEALGGPLSVW